MYVPGMLEKVTEAAALANVCLAINFMVVGISAPSFVPEYDCIPRTHGDHWVEPIDFRGTNALVGKYLYCLLSVGQ